MAESTVQIDPPKARELGLALLRGGLDISEAARRALSVLARHGDAPEIAAPLLECGVGLEDLASRTLAAVAQVEAWDAAGTVPVSVTVWERPWHEAFAEPSRGFAAAGPAVSAWEDGDTSTFRILVARHGRDPVFATAVLKAVGVEELGALLAEEFERRAAVDPGPGTASASTLAALSVLLATASRHDLAPPPERLATAVGTLGSPAAALGLLVGDSTFSSSWLTSAAVLAIPVSPETVDGLRGVAADEARIKILTAVAADPLASAALLAEHPELVLPAALGFGDRGGAAASVVAAAADAPAAQRALATAAVITEIGRRPDVPVQDIVLAESTDLVSPYLDVFRPPGLSHGDFPTRSLPVRPLDADGYLVAVAASALAAKRLSAVTGTWLNSQLGFVTALGPLDRAMALPVTGGVAGRIWATIAPAECTRNEEADDATEAARFLLTTGGSLASALARGGLVVGIPVSFGSTWIAGKLLPDTDLEKACLGRTQQTEAALALSLGLSVLDQLWVNRGANRLFVGEGGTVPPPPAVVLDSSGDHLDPSLDGDQAAVLWEWLSRADVVAGLDDVDSVVAAFSSAAPATR